MASGFSAALTGAAPADSALSAFSDRFIMNLLYDVSPEPAVRPVA